MIPAPAAPRRGPQDRILNFLYKWGDGSAPGLEAESFFTGEEKLNGNHPVPWEPFPQGQEAAPSTRMERLREVETSLSHTAGHWAAGLGRSPLEQRAQDLLGRGLRGAGEGEGGSRTCRAGGRLVGAWEAGDLRGVAVPGGGHLVLQRLLQGVCCAHPHPEELIQLPGGSIYTQGSFLDKAGQFKMQTARILGLTS